MATESQNERRRFSRIPFHVEANIQSETGETYLNCEVIDISLNGLLIVKPANWTGKDSAPHQIALLLENGLTVINMNTAVAHIDNTSVGFICEHIDLTSISHLKRLVELNLGDEDLLQRELSALIH
ncbi:pilus assembly protein PilZ [Methylophaga sp. 42_25_T18]|nr:pilus assembly protein PilZ [Methylophaga sp. 42_25_T18]OUR87833.1 pilus assembly protein PilZ [Methylophaga sp. 42_8_T64]